MDDIELYDDGQDNGQLVGGVRTEKRREQSRSAARMRRQVESQVFADLAAMLAVEGEPTVYQMDRIAILRLALSYYKLRHLAETLFPSSKSNKRRVETLLSEMNVAGSLDGFVLIVHSSGQMVYVSQGVARSVGFTCTDLVGKSLKEYVSSGDWTEFQKACKSSVDHQHSQHLFVRMKTALTPRGGRSRKLTTAISQSLRLTVMKAGEQAGYEYDGAFYYVYCVPVALSNVRLTASLTSLTSRNEMDMKFRFADDKLASVLQYKNSKALVGQSLYNFVHPEDLKHVSSAFRDMYKREHCATGPYRLVTRSGGCVWVSTEASVLVQNVRGVHQRSVICHHQILCDDVDDEASSDLFAASLATIGLKETVEPRAFVKFEPVSDDDDSSENSDDVDFGFNDADWRQPSRTCSDSTTTESSGSPLADLICDGDMTMLAPFVSSEIYDLPNSDELISSFDSCLHIEPGCCPACTQSERLPVETFLSGNFGGGEKRSSRKRKLDEDDWHIALIKSDLVESAAQFIQSRQQVI